MIRSSALYISLIVSLLIVLVCGAMLLLGYTYKMQDKRQQRMLQLRRNLSSGTELLLHGTFKADTAMRIALFGGHDVSAVADSVWLEKRRWGLYELGIVKSWQGMDTLSRAFLIAGVPQDSLKVFYLADEDRPVSISGKSRITGTAYLPKSGIKAAYVESTSYNDKTLVYGSTAGSERTLPEPDEQGWERLADWISTFRKDPVSEANIDEDSLHQSFLKPVKVVRLEPHSMLSGVNVTGKVIVVADSSLTVAASAKLEHVVLIAPYVRIESGFEGSMQVLATDSIYAGTEVRLRYPSALLVLKPDTAGFQSRIKIGKNSVLEAQVIAYEKERSLLMPMVELDSGTLLKGEIWSKGYVALARTSRVEGSVSAIRLMARVGGAIYENYLIDVELSRPRRSRYYLEPKLINRVKKREGVLCWLN